MNKNSEAWKSIVCFEEAICGSALLNQKKSSFWKGEKFDFRKARCGGRTWEVKVEAQVIKSHVVTDKKRAHWNAFTTERNN